MKLSRRSRVTYSLGSSLACLSLVLTEANGWGASFGNGIGSPTLWETPLTDLENGSSPWKKWGLVYPRRT